VNTKREALERMKWLVSVLEIMTAAEAYATQAPGRRFYTIAWWGDDKKVMPAGFTRFDFQQVVGDDYVIIWRDEPRDRVGTIPSEELVLVFSGAE
jgi:hypothetical protein